LDHTPVPFHYSTWYTTWCGADWVHMALGRFTSASTEAECWLTASASVPLWDLWYGCASIYVPNNDFSQCKPETFTPQPTSICYSSPLIPIWIPTMALPLVLDSPLAY
jgi:hypothetical protein